MKIMFSPQIQEDNSERIKFSFEEDFIKIMMPNGTVDEFDFTEVPDGRLSIDSIVSSIEKMPILEVYREGGQLYVTLINYIGKNDSTSEMFPGWIDYTEYVPPIIEKQTLEEVDRFGGI